MPEVAGHNSEQMGEMDVGKKVLGLLIRLMAAALACACNLPFLRETQAPPPGASASDVLFEEEFSDPGSGWGG